MRSKSSDFEDRESENNKSVGDRIQGAGLDLEDTHTRNASSIGSKPLFNTVAIVGVGLMGGSLGMAMLERGLADSVLGIGRNPKSLILAQEIKAVSSWSLELADVCSADLIVIAVSVGSISAVLSSIKPFANSDALITDLGSTKQTIVAEGEKLYGSRFIGSHPMTGSELSGIEAARSDLYTGAAWAVVTSAEQTANTHTNSDRIIQLAKSLGSRPVSLTPSDHDRIIALVSHLPHALSFTFARTVGATKDADIARKLAAGSYKDIMRVASSEPELWRDIFLDNRESVLASLSSFEQKLQVLKKAIEEGNSEELIKFIKHNGG